MKQCRNCAVTVAGEFDKCPLCQSILSGTGDGEQIFPRIPFHKHKHSLLYRLLLLCSAIVVILSLAVNWMFPQRGFWSLFVTAGVACMWVSLHIAIRKRHSILKNLAYQVTIISLASLFWDIFTGWHHWSVDFVIPLAFLSAMGTTAILARIMKMGAGTYIIYLFLLILYGIIPVVFVLFDICKVVYPSLACVVSSLLSLVFLIIFEGRNMVEELKRRLHL